MYELWQRECTIDLNLIQTLLVFLEIVYIYILFFKLLEFNFITLARIFSHETQDIPRKCKK